LIAKKIFLEQWQGLTNVVGPGKTPPPLDGPAAH